MATAQTAQTAQKPLRQMPAVWEATVTKDKAGKKRPASTAPLENAEDRWDPSERARTAVNANLEGDGGHPCGCPLVPPAKAGSTNLPPVEEKRRNRWAMSPPTVSAAPPQALDPDCRFANSPTSPTSPAHPDSKGAIETPAPPSNRTAQDAGAPRS